MAARLWAIILAARLLVAVAVAVWVRAVLGAPDVAAAVAGMSVWIAVPVATVAGSLMAMRRSARVPGAARPMRLPWILCAEALALEMMLLRMVAEPILSWLDRTVRPVSQQPVRVVLVHGIACNRAVWRPLIAALRGAGIDRVYAVNLEPLFADIDTYARDLLAGIEALGASVARPVAIVAHSMGGLVARAALREAKPGTIARIITIGTPHHGTEVACRFGWASTREMCCGSDWLRQLNERQEGRLDVPMSSLYSLDDNLIVPATSARVHGARSVEIRGLAHMSLLCSKRVLSRVVAELRP